MQQIPVGPGSDDGGAGGQRAAIHEVLDDLAYQRVGLANVVYWGVPGSNRWVLIDAGARGTASVIVATADARFGRNARPEAIVLTHAHFDHVGALETLAELWDVPIYAHERELPCLDGRASCASPDEEFAGGRPSALTRLRLNEPVDVSARLLILPPDGSVPPMPGWHWVHTPGHTPGHVSLWREEDRTLIAGDAVITTSHESAYTVADQPPELHGPPMWNSQDRTAVRESVERLSLLGPEVLVTGHGRAMNGQPLREGLAALALEFDDQSVSRRRADTHRPTGTALRSASRAP